MERIRLAKKMYIGFAPYGAFFYIEGSSLYRFKKRLKRAINRTNNNKYYIILYYIYIIRLFLR